MMIQNSVNDTLASVLWGNKEIKIDLDPATMKLIGAGHMDTRFKIVQNNGKPTPRKNRVSKGSDYVFYRNLSMSERDRALINKAIAKAKKMKRSIDNKTAKGEKPNYKNGRMQIIH